MALETKNTLTDETLAVVQDLTAINLDSEKGLQEAAEHCADNAAAKHLFTELALQRGTHAIELNRLAGMNSEGPGDSGTVSGAAHRFLMNIRGKLGGGVPVMLIEAERGEDYIKSKYEGALKEHAGSAITDVLNQQYAAVKAGHDRVRELRDKLNG